MNPSPFAKSAEDKWVMLMHPSYALRKDDVIWMLDFVKKKVAEDSPELLGLPQPRLLTNFRCFAEIAMMLINRHSVLDQDQVRLKELLREASFGLLPKNAGTSEKGR